MSKKLQPVRGTHDFLPDDYRIFEYVTQTAKNIAQRYGLQQIATPIFEFTEVFKRTLGETSDVVGKEMYIFEDRGGESLTLRPEFTAGIARSFISNGLQQNLPLKVFATGPLFRYERPQKGRMRQFHQANFEIIGAKEPIADIEVITLGWQLICELGLQDKITLEINSLGDNISRDNYKNALVKYLSAYKDKLSDDSQRRLELNPMRILDSKDENDIEIVQNAPNFSEYYSDQAQEFFNKVKGGLDNIGVKYKVNPRLVRGLDYYCHTAFEFKTTHLGAQNAVLAGGRYDNLIEMMGGPPTPAIGFAAGIERLVALLDKKIKAPSPITIIPIGENAENQAIMLAVQLRGEGFYVQMSYNGNIKKRFKKADNLGSCAAVIFGDDELKKQIVQIKDFTSGESIEVGLETLSDKLRQYTNR